MLEEITSICLLCARIPETATSTGPNALSTVIGLIPFFAFAAGATGFPVVSRA
jgi:hypothetical protein